MSNEISETKYKENNDLVNKQGNVLKNDTINLDDSKLYLNKEISWLRLHERILEESRDPNHPLLERVKFLAICGGNLDEFFMVRVSALRQQASKGALKLPPDGMTPQEQLSTIRRDVLAIIKAHDEVWNRELLPQMKEEGIRIVQAADLNEMQMTALRKYFERHIFPTLTPLAMDVSHPFPFISNLSRRGSTRRRRIRA